jgi:hypothetical protein
MQRHQDIVPLPELAGVGIGQINGNTNGADGAEGKMFRDRRNKNLACGKDKSRCVEAVEWCTGLPVL